MHDHVIGNVATAIEYGSHQIKNKMSWSCHTHCNILVVALVADWHMISLIAGRIEHCYMIKPTVLDQLTVQRRRATELEKRNLVSPIRSSHRRSKGRPLLSLRPSQAVSPYNRFPRSSDPGSTTVSSGHRYPCHARRDPSCNPESPVSSRSHHFRWDIL